jgi:hypothetical protein
MNKKELFASFLVAALSLLFVAICFMVFVSGGKSKKWISRKMWIGGLLLSLTVVAQTGCRRTSCYMVSREFKIHAKRSKSQEIIVKQVSSDLIKGKIRNVHSEKYSFVIQTSDSGKDLRKGNLIPVDGKFDHPDEFFEIKLEEKLDKGEYILTIYGHYSNDESLSYPIESLKIKI